MPGDVEFLDAVRRTRDARLSRRGRTSAAASYVRRAEEALTVLPQLSELDERAAVCRIIEAWLALAEGELAKPATAC